MDDTRVLDEVGMNLAVARGNVLQAWNTVGSLRGYARGAARAVEDAQDVTARARLARDGLHRAAHLGQSGDQMDIVRQRCTMTSHLAGDVLANLEVAKRHVGVARDRLDEYEPGASVPAQTQAELVLLRARAEQLAGLVELATPLAQAARTHMQAAAEAAAGHISPSIGDSAWEAAVQQVERGVQTAGRAVARADESSRHLDRAVEYVNAGADRSVRHADEIAAAADERLRSAQGQTRYFTGSPDAPRPSR